MKDILKLKEFAKDMTVLYVEYNPKLREEMVSFLQNFFAISDSAKNGDEGLTLYKKNRYDLVISCVQMPKINKIDSIEMINQILSENQKQLIMCISEYNDLIPKLDKKVNSLLLRPISQKDLIVALEELCELYHESEGYNIEEKCTLKDLRKEITTNKDELLSEIRRVEQKLDELLREIKKRDI